MEWLNYLHYLLEKWSLQALLLLASLAWLLLRLLRITVVRAENGENLHIRVLGQEFIAVESDTLQELRGRVETGQAVELDTRRRVNRISSKEMEERDS